METETNIPEDASATSLPLVESITKIDSEEMKFSQKNGNDVKSKYPLIEETRQADSGKICEVSEPRPQEIYQESSKARAESEKKAEHQPERYSIENKMLRHTNSGGLVMVEIIPKSSSPEDEAPSTLPTLAFDKVDAIEDLKMKPHQTLMEEESTVIDNNKCRPENADEKTTKVLEGIGLPESMGKVCQEKEQTEHHSETQSMEKVIMKHINSKEMMTTERSTKLNYDTKELEKIPESHSDENLKIKDGGNIILPEEAKDIKDATDVELQKSETGSVLDDKATLTLPTIASIQVETAERNVHEEIHKEAESAVKDTNERQRTDNDFEENMKVLEALDPHEATVNTSMENEKKAQPQIQTQIQETMVLKHLNLEGLDTAETIPRNDTGELENVPVSHTVERLEVMDGGKFKHEEAKEMGEETDTQFPETAKESEPADEASSVLPKSVVIEEGEMAEKSFEKETHEEEESAAIDNNQSCRPQNELEQMSRALEAIDLSQTVAKDAAENEHTDHQSEAPRMENVITKHSNSEGNLTTESSTKSSYLLEELEKIPGSHSVDNSEIKYGGKIMPEKAIDMKEANEVELQKSETESVLADKALSTLHTTASVRVETVEQSIKEEIHREVESAVTDNKQGQRPEKDFEEKKNVLEAIDLHEATGNTCLENGKKAEIQTEVQNLETIVTKHLNLEGQPIEVNTSNDTEDREKVPMTHTEEELEIKKGRKCIQEEAKYMEEAIEDEALLTIPTLANVKGETVEESFQEQNLKEEELAATNNNNSNQPEYELEQTANVIEAIDQPETMANISAQNEQHADHQSEASTTEIVIEKHINAEGKVTAESSTKLSYDVDELEKNPDSHSVNNSEVMGGSKISTGEATDIKEATNVELQQPKIQSVTEDKILSNLHPTEAVERVEDNIQEEIYMEEEIPEDEAQSKLLMSEIVKGEKVQEILQQQTHQEEESAATDNTKSCRTENELNEMTNVVEINNQPETMAKVSAENEEQDDHQSVVSSIDSVIAKNINIEGRVTSASSSKSIYDVDKLEKIPESHSVANSEIKDGSEIMQEEATNIKESTDVDLQKSGGESVSEDKALSNLPNAASVRIETAEESIEEKLHRKAESEVIDTKEGQIPENNFEEKKKVPKEFSLHDMTHHTSAENEKKAKPQSEVQNLETTMTKNPNLEGEITEINQTNDSEEHEKILLSHTGEKLHIEDDGKFTQEEAKKLEHTTDMQILKTATKSVPEDEAQLEVPVLAIVKAKTEEALQQQTLQEEESAVIDNDNSSRPENELEKMANVVEALDQPETIAKASAKDGEHADNLLEASSMESVITKQINAKGKKTSESSPKSSYDVDEKEKITVPHSVKNSEINDGSEITLEEATDSKGSDGVPEDKAQQTLPKTASVGVAAVETIIQQEIHTEAELGVTDTKEGPMQENDFEEQKKVPEAFGLHEVTHKTSAENELKAEPQSEAQNQETTFIKHPNLEGESTDVINPINYIEEQEKDPASHAGEKLDIEHDGIFKQEKAKEMEEATEMQIHKTASQSVPEDKALHTPPSTASIGFEAVETGIQDEIHAEAELAVTNTKMGQIEETDFEEQEKNPEAFGLHEVRHQTTADIERKVEPQSEAQNQETTFIKHLNFGGKSTDVINPINSIEEQEKDPASQTGEKLDIEHDGIFKQEEAKEMEEAAEMQIQKTPSESVPEDKAQQTLPSTTSLSVEAVDASIHNEIHPEAVLAVTNTKEKQIPDIDFEKKKKVPKAFSLYEVTHLTSAENEMKAAPQFDVQNQETTFIKHRNLEGINETGEQEKVPSSHTSEKLEIKDDGKFIQEDAKEMEEAIEMQLLKTASKSISEDKVSQTLTNPDGVEAAVESIQEEIHPEAELAVTNTKEGHIQEIDFEEKKEVPEIFSLLEVTQQTNVENEQKVELQSEAQNQETTFIKHLNLEGKTKGVPEHKALQTSPSTASVSEEAVEESIQEGRIPMEAELAVTNTKEGKIPESALEDKALQTLPITASATVEAIEESIQEEILSEAELIVKRTKELQIPEMDFEEKKKVPETFGLHEVINETCAENKAKAEPRSEVQNQGTTFMEEPDLEGKTTDIMKPTDINEEHKNVPVSYTGEKTDIEDGWKFTQEEAKEMEEATEMKLQKTASESEPEDKALQTLPITVSATVESIEEIHTEAELTVKSTKEVQIPEMDFEQKNKVPKVFDLHEVINKTCAENKVKAEPQSEVQNQGTTFIEEPDLEGKTTDIMNPTNNSEEHENVTASYTGKKIDIEDEGKFIQEEAKEMEEATEMKLQKTAIESVPEDKALQTLLSPASVNVEAVDISIEEEIHAEAELAPMNSKGQIQEIDFEEKNEVHEAFSVHEVTCQISMENELNPEHHSEKQNQTVTFMKHLNLQGDTTEINPTNDTEEQEKFPASQSRQKLEIEDDGKFTQEKVKEMEEETDMQSAKTATESVPEDKAQSTTPILTIVNAKAGEILSGEQTLQEDKNAAMDNDKTCREENELEKTADVEAINHPKTTAKVSVENDEYADHQSKASSKQSMITKHINAEGKVTLESSIRSTYDIDEQKIPESHSIKNSETKDGSKIMSEEAINTKELIDVDLQKSETESVREDIALPTLPNTASVGVGVAAIETSIQQEIYMEEESASTDSKEGQILEDDFEKIKKDPEAFVLHEVTHQTSAENKLNAEPQSEAQKQETTFIKHSNSEGKSTDIINPTNDNEEQERVPELHTREKLKIVDDGKSIQGEAKVIEEVTEMHLLKTTTESVPEDETKSTMPTLAIVEGENEEILHQQTLQGDESAAIDNNKSCRQENELGETADVVEEIDHPQTMAKVRAENKEQADHQLEALSMQRVIIKDINAEGKESSDTESNTKSSHGKEEKVPGPQSVENSEINDGSKIRSEEATDMKESTNVEIQKSETESVPEDKVQPNLPDAAFISVEAADGSIQEEIHSKGKLAVANTKEGKIPENDFEEKKKVPEAFDLHEVTDQTSTENKQKAEPQPEVQNHETTVIMHPNLEGKTTEIKPTNETEEHEKIPVSPTMQKLETEDDGKFIPEEAKDMEEATEMQLLKTATECVPEDEKQSALPTSTIVKDEKVEEFFKEQTVKVEEAAAIDNNKSCRPENELEQTTNVVEATDEPKTMSTVRSENEEDADHQSKQSSYDEEEREKVPKSDSVDNSEIKDGGKTMPEKAIDIKEATDVELQKPEIESVPEDKVISPLSTVPSVRVEIVEESIQEEIKKEAESAVIDAKEEQTPKNDFVENTKVLEAFDLHKATSSTGSENKKKDEPEFNVQRMDTAVIKHSNKEGLETTEISPSIDTEDLEKVSVSHTREKLEIKDGGIIKQEEAREREEATEMSSLKTATESVHDGEAPSTFPTSAIVKGEMAGQSFQEQTLKEEESTVIDKNKSSRPENELQQTTKILEPIAQPETTDKVGAENDENANHKSEAPSMEKVITKQINSEGMVTIESSRKTSYNVDELEKIPEKHLVDNSKIEDAGKIIPEEAINIKEAIDVELQKSETESVPEDKAFSTLSTIASIKDETFEKSIQEETHKEAESSVTDNKEGQRPENEFEENTKVLEAFDQHKETGYTCTENERKVEAQYEAQSQENMVIKHPNLEGLERTELSPTNDTKELEKEHKVAKPADVSELLSADITRKCSNEDIPMLKDSEKEEKLFIVAFGCTATSTPKNSETIEGQENIETTFEDSLTGVAMERVTTELETEDSSHEQETTGTDDTPAEKIVKAADTNENLKLAPESMAKEQSNTKNCFDASMHTADGTFIDDEKGEKVRNSLESSVADKVAAKLDPDGQSDMHESTKMDKSDLPVEKILEPPYPCKKLESYFDSEAHNQTKEQLSQTKERSNNIPDQISESDDHIQGQKFKRENQMKPEPQMDGEHHFSIALNAKPASVASLITEVHEGVDRAGGSEKIEEQTKDSGKSLSEIHTSFPREETVNQVKDHDKNDSKATDSNESFENDPTRKEATSRDSDEAIEQAATGKLETRDAEITQVDSAKVEKGGKEGRAEFEKISPLGVGSDKKSGDSDMKASHKKSHGILSGVGSKVKHSISKVKKAITGKSSHPKTPSSK